MMLSVIFFFKQKTAYEMRISDWSSDVCSSDLAVEGSTADVKYVGAFYESGDEFDSSWSGGADETIPVPLGAGAVIPGFKQGIEGMKRSEGRWVGKECVRTCG